MKGIPLALALVMSCAAWAQSPGTVVLRLDFKNAVGYVDDELDRSKWAMSAEITPPSINQRNFGTFTHISDLVQVNGTPVKGVLMCRFAISRVSPSIPNWGAGDVSVANDASCTVEIFQADAAATPIGSISYNQRTTPMRKAAGAPSIIGDSALGPIVGGTGAYFGVRGEMGACAPCGGTGAQRTASVREDPLLRRQLGGTEYSLIFLLIPWRRPEVLIGPNGPVFFHSGYIPVTSANPAAAGETLILYAKGLGPTTPGLNPGAPFPNEPFANATSPVEVWVDGKSSPAITQIGVPGTTDTYRVDFRVPDSTVAGTASVQISAAWVTGTAVSIPVR